MTTRQTTATETIQIKKMIKASAMMTTINNQLMPQLHSKAEVTGDSKGHGSQCQQGQLHATIIKAVVTVLLCRGTDSLVIEALALIIALATQGLTVTQHHCHDATPLTQHWEINSMFEMATINSMRTTAKQRQCPHCEESKKQQQHHNALVMTWEPVLP